MSEIVNIRKRISIHINGDRHVVLIKKLRIPADCAKNADVSDDRKLTSKLISYCGETA